ncbi:polysaccharide pyruvyl transferase family protein [Gaetbulibacter aquiaggeris]|uniref:Polysaccharide pyruvyl transferase family protein n=1 Tax=Gaetbulibacter aquiaggeris TaxID=1735373 RepID=A0ABW7MS38_9FLAO
MIGNNKIALFGTFDVDNYGDLLFPFLAEHRLENYKLEFVSPTNTKTIFKDAKSIICFDDCVKKNYNAVIIGGGNILHLKPNVNTVYGITGFSYADLWIGAIKLAGESKIPSLFNSPGIPEKFKSDIEEKIVYDALISCSYISVREIYSEKIIKDLFNQEIIDINVVPDTAFEISKVWPLENQLKNNVITINLNSRYHNPADETAKWIDKIALKFNSDINFVVIGECHGDSIFTNLVAKRIVSKYEIHRSDNLKELAQCIGRSRLFIGSSMHGFITALSYKTPAFMVLNNKPMHKFLGLYELCDLKKDSLCSSFNECYLNIDKPAILSNQTVNKISTLLDAHWNHIKNLIQNKHITKSTQNLQNYRLLLKMSFRENNYNFKKSLRLRIKKILKKILSFE